MRALIVVNDAPYGSERAYNGLRLAGALAKQPGAEIMVFLIGDAAACAKRGQRVPSGYYNVQTMLTALVQRGARIGVCGSCMDARGIAEPELVEGTRRSSIDELTAWTLEAEKVITF